MVCKSFLVLFVLGFFFSRCNLYFYMYIFDAMKSEIIFFISKCSNIFIKWFSSFHSCLTEANNVHSVKMSFTLHINNTDWSSLSKCERLKCVWPMSSQVVLFFTFFFFCILLNSVWSHLPNPSARAGYYTRSIFKRSFTGLNSEFSFS